MKQKQWLINNKLSLIGLLIGALAGFFYWYFVGCASGTCPIKSNPWYSSMYGAVLGALFLSLFKKNNTNSTPHANNI